MSDININRAPKADLLRYATETLGMEIAETVNLDELRVLVRRELGEVPDAPVAAVAAPSGVNKSKELATILIPKDKMDKQRVQVFYNHHPYIIERGKEVTVPRGVLEILNNAMTGHLDPETNEIMDVLRFPYQVVR